MVSSNPDFNDASDAVAADDLIRAARFNDAVGWVRLPIFVIVSTFIFVFLNFEIGLAWLAAAIATDRISVYLRRRTAQGDRRFALPYLLSLFAISGCWVAHALLIWFSGGEMQHIVSIIDLFMVMIYGITGGQHSRKILAALVVIPLITFFGLIVFDLWTSMDFVTATCGTLAAFGACVAVLATAMSSNRSAESLQRANQDLQHALVELDKKRKEAEDASNAKNEFLALISHEIRTPMNGVIGMLEVLLRSTLGPEQREHASIAQRSASDLLHLLDDVIDISRLEARRIAIENRPFKPSDIVDGVVALFRVRAEAKGLVLQAEMSGVPGWVSGDARRIRQVLTNLVGNAIKFTESGTISVSVSYVGSELCVSIHDTGIGLNNEVLAKVFTPFYQVDSSNTRSFGGAGLGLSICKQLIEVMGGEIGVESAHGEGSRFWFSLRLPIAEASDVAMPAEQSDMRPMRILIAEDNVPMQRILAALLNEFGHTISIVENGADAVAAVATGDFDVVLMDVMMPVMNGPTAAGRIREPGGRPGGIPIIGLTANALVGDRDRYIAAGMTDCLSKPVDVGALFSALGRAEQSVPESW